MIQLTLFNHCNKCNKEKPSYEFKQSKIKTCLDCLGIIDKTKYFLKNLLWIAVNPIEFIKIIENKKQKRLERKRKEKRQSSKKPLAKLKHNIRRRIRKILKSQGLKKDFSSIKAVGCTSLELKQHIESQFSPGMNWDNYGKGPGKWNADHVKPLSKFNLSDKEEIKKANHYTNLQPLWDEDNNKKRDKYDII